MSIRLAVWELPQMLVDVVRAAFAAEPDVSVEVLPRGDGDLSAAIRRAGPDVAIVCASTGREPDCELLLRHPGLVLLTLTDDARDGWVCELRPAARHLAEVSLGGLRTAVREAVGRNRAGGHGLG